MPIQDFCAPTVFSSPTFRQGVKATGRGATLYLSGQVAIDGAGRPVGRGDFAAQARQALQNVKDMVEAGGGRLADVVKLTFYLTRIDDRAALVPIRHEFFGAVIPPSTLVAVAALAHPDLLIEIDAVAVVPGE